MPNARTLSAWVNQDFKIDRRQLTDMAFDLLSEGGMEPLNQAEASGLLYDLCTSISIDSEVIHSIEEDPNFPLPVKMIIVRRLQAALRQAEMAVALVLTPIEKPAPPTRRTRTRRASR